MGYLSSVEDPVTGTTLQTFVPMNPVGEMGWEHRNATTTVANIQFGSSPFAPGPAPFAPRKWPWGVRMEGRGGFDAAKDTFARSVGFGMPVRLVYAVDGGYTRICNNAVAYPVRAPFNSDSFYYYDFNVEWELNSHWQERDWAISGAVRCGQVPNITCGGSPTVYCGALASLQTIVLSGASYQYPTTYSDASVAGPGGIPSLPDTGCVITISGPCGGVNGFTLQNFGVPGGNSVFTFGRALIAGEYLVLDVGAKQYRVGANGGYTDVSSLCVVPPIQPWDFAIWPGVVNSIVMTWLGTISQAPTAASTMNLQWRRYWN